MKKVGISQSILLILIVSFLSAGCAAPSRQEKVQEKLEPVIIFGDGESDSIEFVEKKNHIYIPVTIPPLEPKYFLVDTGWGGSSALRSDIVEAMGLEKYKERKYRDLAGKVKTTSWKVDEVRLGGQDYDKFFVLTSKGQDKSLGGFSKGVGVEVIGILSVRFMEKFITGIDFDAGLIHFDPDVSGQSPCGGARSGEEQAPDPSVFVASFSLVNWAIRAETRFNDLPLIVTLSFDTGSDGTMITKRILENLGEEVGSELGFKGKTKKSRHIVAAHTSTFKSEEIRVASIAMGGAKLLDFPLTMTAGTSLGKGVLTTDGLLGMDFLRNFNMRLDLKNKCVALEKNANYYVYEGDRLRKDRNFEASAEAYRKAVARKDCSLTRGRLGKAYAKLGDHEQAMAEFGRAVEMDDTIAWPHMEMGCLYHEQEEYARAEEAFRKALDLDPEYVRARKKLAALYADQGRCEDAMEACRPLLEEKPEKASLRVDLGKIYQTYGCYDQAVASYREAAAMKKDYDWAHLRMGTAFQDQGQFDAALQAYQRALDIDPDYYWAHMRVGLTCEELGRLEESAAAYARASEVCKKFCEADLFLYFVDVQRGHEARAGERLAASLEEGSGEKDKSTLLRAAASLLLDRGDEEAVFSAVKSDSDEDGAHFYVGRHCMTKGDRAGAMEHFRKAAEEVDVGWVENAAARYELRRSKETPGE